MMRKFTHYVLMSAIWFSVVSCDDEEISTPPKPTVQANKTTAQVGEEISFTINQVNADAISLLPYGLPSGDAGVLVNNFTDGVATVGFSYSKPGTFQAIAVANNHSSDGESIQNVKSDPITITITSSKNSISGFTFIKLTDTPSEVQVSQVSTETVIDEDAKTITVTVPYGTDVTKLLASFTASDYATVSVGGTEQKNEESVNNFSSPVVYKVTANDGTTSNYTVTVNVTPVEKLTAISSISATAVSKAAKDKELLASVDSTSSTIVIYDTLGTTSDQFDSVRVGYELNGKFALLKYGTKVMKQDSLLDLTETQTFKVYSQDSTNLIQTYSVHATDAPKLTLSFPGLTPDPAVNVEPTDFSININVLEGTDVESIVTNATIEYPTGVTLVGIEANDALFVPGVTAVDYSDPVEFKITVNDTRIGVTYTVTYTVNVTVVP